MYFGGVILSLKCLGFCGTKLSVHIYNYILILVRLYRGDSERFW